MFGFLGFILLFIFLIIIIVLTLLGNIIRMIFGFGKCTPKQFNSQKNETDDYNTKQQATEPNGSTTEKKKIFGKDEGEYVEFEEIK